MEIKKDKRYFAIYLTCVILATILTIAVIVFLICMSMQDDINFIIFIIPIFAIVGDLFAYNSFIGYIKTPDVILKLDENSITFTPDKTKKQVTLKFEEIKGVQVVRPLICRSGKTIIINTDTARYKLEDINDIDSAYNALVDKVKG